MAEEERPDFEDDPDIVMPSFMRDITDREPVVPVEDEKEPPGLEEEFPDDSYQDILGLMWLGHLERTFRWGGHTFTIRTLKLGEELAITQVIDEWKDTIGLGKAGSAATVAASLEYVDGQPIVERLNRNATSNIRDKFLAIIDEDDGWYWGVIEYIFNEYSALQIRQAELFQQLQSK